jgi:RNA polymerase sigma-70 factor, ECF subfamily
MLNDPSEAEDMVQETFIRVYNALPRYEERQRFEAWLFQILGNCCRNVNASAHNRTSQSLDALETLELISAPARRDGDMNGWGDAVRRALADVPEYNREVFLLHYVDGFSYEEIRGMTGVAVSALKMRAKRAADQLRRTLVSRERTYD